MQLIVTLLKYSLVLVLFSAMRAGAALPLEFDHDISYEELKETLLDRYEPLVKQLAGSDNGMMLSMQAGDNKADSEDGENIEAWWHTFATSPLSGMPRFAETDISDLYGAALNHSSQIKVFSYLPRIRKTTIQEADGQFDTRFYADGLYNKIDEPVGDELRTGGPERYEEESGSLAFGIERKFLPGTKLVMQQEFESFDSNSTYLEPTEQGHSKTSLSITQPLLRGFGADYNGAVEDLAKIDYASANSELKRQIDSHLLEVARAYWGLYLERSLYLQKRKLSEKTEEIVRQMEERKDIDIDPSLLARARSQMFGHQLAADEAQFAILNAQSRLWTLSSAPELVNENGLEFVTVQQPKHNLSDYSLIDILKMALVNRPEISQSIRQIQSALIRHYRTQNELLPDLDLFAETYVKGLEDDYDHTGAFNESWDEGEPSYSVGLKFAIPLMNNGSKARELRKKLEIQQLLSQLDTTVTNILLEAQISFRELIKYNMAMKRRFAMVAATNEEIINLVSRVDYLISINEDYGSILNRLLDALQRLNRAEMEFSTSELTYNLAIYQLKSAKGTLVKDSGVILDDLKLEASPLNKINVNSLEITGVEAVPQKRIKINSLEIAAAQVVLRKRIFVNSLEVTEDPIIKKSALRSPSILLSKLEVSPMPAFEQLYMSNRTSQLMHGYHDTEIFSK